MSSLFDELKGVTADVGASPDANDDPNAAPVTEPEGAEGAGDPEDQPVDDPAKAGKDGRPIENVRRELLRKQHESEERVLERIGDVVELVKSLVGTGTSEGKKSAQAPSAATGLDGMTVEQLRAVRGQVPAEQKDAFESYLTERTIAETVDRRMRGVQEEQKFVVERKNATQRAVRAYPDLTKPGSVLAREVDRRLQATDENQVKYNPRIVLNLAEDVASEMGIHPQRSAGTRRVPEFDAGSAGKPVRKATNASDNEPNVIASDTEFENIASRLKHALRGGKSFDKDSVMKRGKEYGKFFQGGNQ
jgi:hypothetical protein